MDFIHDYVKHRAQSDPAFQHAWEDGTLKWEIAKQFIGIRLELEMTQEQFAEHIGVKQSFLSQLENGEHNLTIETLQQLAQRAGATVHVHLVLHEPPTP
ncbi:helix-turn-helix domain-containing protein [Sulfobacillus harzensis]|uniref:Helix-turn-helix transcriptional regulator n=1 Tax=Sulfobacillus harzensis TaxID=2729629 RepID=A0A7Y0L3J2_9FIRM|nr:helix-turn-helix transcriptional regulator [Sulfobacillus harzensis]NMP22641.1 helix-turn-helix transcriptional regulator [Sulfobacillus harzensis]